MIVLNKLFLSVFICIASVNVFAQLEAVPAAPKIKAKSYIVIDHHSGDVIVDQNSDIKLPPASLTKIMTVYVVAKELEKNNINLTDEVLVSEKAWKMPGSRMFIEVGNKITVDNLLKGVIIQSGNDASVALSEYVSGDESVFVQLMNQYAKNLGMDNTNYENSTGLPSENHYTTASDLAKLSNALIREFPDVYELHSIKEFEFNDIKQPNRNKLLWRDSTVDGIKTGHTEEAGYCLAASAFRDDMRLVVVVMGTDSEEARAKSTQALLNYGYRFYETRKIYSGNQVIDSVKVWKGEADSVPVTISEDLYMTIPRGKYNNLEAKIEIPNKQIAPISEGQILGTLAISLGNEKMANIPLKAKSNIGSGGFFKKIKDHVLLMME